MTTTSTIHLKKREKKPNRICFLEPKESLESVIERVSMKIAPVWPLNTAIACNPLLGFEQIPFWEALKQMGTYEKLFKQNNEIKEYLKVVNEPMIKWLKAFLDEEQAILKIPNKSLGFFSCWKELVIFDKTIVKTKEHKNFLSKLPDDPIEALEYGLKYLKVGPKILEKYIILLFNTLPGFCGYIKWKNDWNLSATNSNPITLTDVLAVRVITTILLLNHHTPLFFKAIDECEIKDLLDPKQLLESKEKNYRKDLIENLKNACYQPKSSNKRIKGQLIFCIDVRSEPLRKALEQIGDWETFGFAGFFGLPISILKENIKPIHSCPALFKKTHVIKSQTPSKKSFSNSFKLLKNKNTLLLKAVFKDLKYNFATAFTLAESMGLFCGLWMGLKTFYPKRAQKLKDIFTLNSEKLLAHSLDNLSDLPYDLQLEIAYKSLCSMGLTDNFACLVVVAGHKSITTNNSYASSLDCGACGANPGGLNAKIFTIILNDKKIREGLIFKGISIPENTTFIAAEHNTVTNELEFLDGSNLSLQALENFELLKQDLNTLSNTFDVEKNKTKCFDWSQIRPEMGLCKNASFIIAPRNLTANINLDAKTFLHSYDPLKDPEGLLLEQILQGPLVVAEWINMQYFFSTYNNKLFGGGSKLSHNIVGNFGVMQGNLSDLMHGLSFESVYLNDKEIFHEPMRLQTFIYSDLNCVKRIFEKYENLKNLLVNEWIHVFVIDKQSLGIYQLTKDLTYSLQIEEKINYYEATV